MEFIRDYFHTPYRVYKGGASLLTAACAVMIAAVLAITFSGSVLAQEVNPDPPTDDEVNAIAKELYCPVCENTPLDVCPTQACEEWRQLIYDKLTLGWNEEQIKIYFSEQYGDRVLAAPPARGLNLMVYILPPLIFIGGIIILYRAFNSWRKNSTIVEPQEEKNLHDDEYIKRLEDELREF